MLTLPVLLAAGMATVIPPAAPVAAAPPSATKPVCPAELPDEQAALTTARVCGGPIVIANLTSPTDQAIATPAGAVELKHNFRPVRARQGTTWVDVDTDLEPTSGGRIAAKVSPTAVTFSGDGTGPMVTITDGSNTVGLNSPVGPLPVPSLDKDTATYHEVLPGVDLRLRADVYGYSQVLVVKTAAAAANPKLRRLSFALTGKGITLHADAAGNLRASNTKGKVVLVGSSPLMWDAAADAAQGNAPTDATPSTRANTPATGQGRHARMPVKLSSTQLSIDPDQRILTGADTVYPVFIDPGLTVNRAGFTVVNSAAPTTSFWNSTDDAYVGSWDGGTSKFRSLFSYDLTGSNLAGKYVSSAQLNLYEKYAGTCQPAGFEVWSTDLPTSSSTWNNQPAWYSQQSTSTVTKGYSPAGVGGASDCPAGTVPMSVTSYLQSAATNGWNGVAFGVRATDETDPNAWKRFSNNPTLSITYTAYPTTSALSTSPSAPCVTGSARPYVNTASPLLQARLTDPEGASVRPEFEWSVAGGARIASVQPTPGKASGTLMAATVPAGDLANNGSYAWRVRAFDGTTWGPWSGYCEFTVDTTSPSTAPTVTSSTYPSGAWAGAAGTAGTFTFGASGTSDIAAYVYGLDTTTPATTVNTASLGGGASVLLTPSTDGPHTLVVKARDRAGNLSPATTYAFNVGTGAVTSPRTGDLSAGKFVLQGKGKATTSGVTFQRRRADIDTWVTIPASDVVTESGGTAVTWPVAASPSGSGTYPRLVWNVEKTVNDAEAGADALDGPVQIRASFAGTTTGTSSAITTSLNRNQASAATQEIGPGSVNLLTGNYTVGDTDVSVDAYGSDLTVTRTYNTRTATASDTANMFGPGWTSSAMVEDADTPYTRLTRTGNLVQVGLPDGNTIGFTAKDATTYTAEPGSENLQLASTTTPDAYTLTDDAGTVVTFTRVTGSPVGTYHPTSVTQPGSAQTTTITWEKVTIGTADVYRPTRMLAPVPAGVTCTTLVQGCRALTITYATATTATGTTTATLGDYLGRVKQISITAWNPDLTTPAMATAVLARYAYDNTGKLRSTWDPRLDYNDGTGTRHLDDAYTYNTDGVLATITPPGQPAWQLGYTTIPGDAGKGRLATVTRSALSAGTATTTVVYKIPTGNTGPNDLSATQTARWGQSVAPVDATAVYPPTQIPDGNQGTGVLPSSADRAAVVYLDANGRTVNTGAPGGRLSATWYDTYDNVVRSLDAINLENALYASDTDTTTQEAARAERLSTVNTYSDDGRRLLDTVGPEHSIVLTDYSDVRGRTHTRNAYDENAPATTNPYNLVTTSTTTVQYLVNGIDTDTDARTTTTGYNWTLRQPSTVTVDPGGLNLVTTTAYDSTTGLVTAITTPAGNGSITTPSTQTTTYYRAGTGSGYTDCDNHPEWANLACRVAPGGQPATGAELPATITTYDMFNQPRVVAEKTSIGTLRTTTTTYDNAGRAYETSVSASGLGTAVPTTRNIYDPTTGQQTRTQSIVGGSVTAEIIRAYDTLGRQISYTDADGVASTTTYDMLSRPATTNDGKATRTYTYDGGTERRGLLTQVVDSQAGTFTATYDSAGKVTHETWPTGVTTNEYYDETGGQNGIEYLTTSTCTTAACTLYYDYTGQDAHGSTRWDSSALDSSGYVYDNAGRLTYGAHTVTGQCTMHQYTYDNASNRTAMTTYGPNPGDCDDSNTTAQRTWTYDTANRTTTSGYTYDTLGRTLTSPLADATRGAGDVTFTYHATDLIDTITQSGRTTDYTLDVTGERIRSWTDTTTGTTPHTNHYDSDDDNPSWTQETATTYTRPLAGINRLAGIYDSATNTVDYQITNLHGDLNATIHGAATGLSTTYTTDEYGNPTASGNPRYGWLGSKQRAGDTPAGIILMGVRLYNPLTGRFLQEDPIYGGNANPYDYCNADPINCTDLDGKWSWRKVLKGAAIVGGIVGALACGASIVCGLAVGAASAAAGYAAMHYRNKRSPWRWKSFAKETAIGGAFGAAHGTMGRALGHSMKSARYGVTWNKARSARGTDFRWKGKRIFGIHSHRISGDSRWKFVHYHRRGPGGIKNHRPWQGRW